jgi:hypothetical protein
MALPLMATLIIIGWKKDTLRTNARICGLTPGLGFRIRIYLSIALDLLRFLHGHYGSPITSRSRDTAKLERLRSGPSLFLTAHFHNWELMGAWLTRQGIPLVSAARPMAQGLSQSLLIRLRNRKGMKVLSEDVPRRALRHIQGGGCFGLIWDQRAPASKTRAPLFGRTLGMDPLPRFLTRHAAVPVYFGVLLPGGGFRVLQIAAPRSAGSGSRKHPASFPLSGTSKANHTDSTQDTPRPSLSSLGSSKGPGPTAPPSISESGAGALPNSASASSLDSNLELDISSGSSPHSDATPQGDSPLPLTRIPFGSGPNLGQNDGIEEADRSGEIDRLGRRYHRILECLVRAHPTSWYGLTHRRFLG